MNERAPFLSRRAALNLLISGTGALLAACQSAPPAANPTTAPSPSAAVKPAPAGSPAPAASPSSAAPAAGWEKKWDELIEAAKKEGKVVVSGPGFSELRTELSQTFQKRYGVEMEYLATPSTATVMSRLQAERGSGTYTLDAILAGAQSLFTVAYPEKMIDPILPALINPEATDPTKWADGKPRFMDPEGKYVMRITNTISLVLAINTDEIKPSDIPTWKSLLEPKFKGKISAWDPGIAGTGWNTANYLLRTLGDDYVKKLYIDQQTDVSRDARQLSDWLVRNVRPISLGLSGRDIEELKRDGLPAGGVVGLPDAPGHVSGGFGHVVLMNKAPHPNAAQLFINWMAMKEGVEIYNRSQSSVGLRTDITNEWAPDYVVPKPGVDYFDSNGWDYTINEFTPEKLARIKQLTGR